MQYPLIRHGADHQCLLERGDRHVALTNRDREGLSRIPRLLTDLSLPLGARNQTSLFGAEFDSGRLSQAEEMGVLGDRIYPKAISHFIEVYVARFNQSAMKIDRPMPSFFPIFEVPISEGEKTATLDPTRRGRFFRLQERRAEHDLKSGAGRILSLDHTVGQGPPFIFEKGFPCTRGSPLR